MNNHEKLKKWAASIKQLCKRKHFDLRKRGNSEFEALKQVCYYIRDLIGNNNHNTKMVNICKDILGEYSERLNNQDDS